MSLSRSSFQVAQAGLLIALAFGLSYLEFLVPLPLPVGVKLGLANVVTLVALFRVGNKTALLVLLCRCVLVALLFGRVSALLFSLAGGLLAYLAMLGCKQAVPRHFSIYGVSMAGAAAHHLGQIGVAIWYLQSTAVLSYLPILLVLSIPTGLLTAWFASRLLLIHHTRLN